MADAREVLQVAEQHDRVADVACGCSQTPSP
jgi:hypothetical protein